MSKVKIISLSDNDFTIETNGLSFHICLGSNTYGNYIAIPNWGVCTEAASWDDTFYNKEKLSVCINDIVSENAETIAKAVNQYMN